MELIISASFLPFASSIPTVRFRLRSPLQVSTKSPNPARPDKVFGGPPSAMASRVISARPRVINAAMALLPRPKSVADAGADRDDVFQRRSQFHAHRVVVGIQAKRRSREFPLDGRRQLLIRRRDHHRGGLPARHLARERRARREPPRADRISRRSPGAPLPTSAAACLAPGPWSRSRIASRVQMRQHFAI